jgi:hypothetical protein
LTLAKKRKGKKQTELSELLMRLRERLISSLLISPVVRRMARMAAAKSFGLGTGALFKLDPIFNEPTFEDLQAFYSNVFDYGRKTIFISQHAHEPLPDGDDD